MQRLTNAMMALLVGLVAASNSQADETPVAKVIQMLGGMLDKGKTEKHEEAVAYAAYKQWCDDTEAEKKLAVTQADQQITMLNADIQAADTEAATLGEEITELDQKVAGWEADVKASTAVRETERTDYTAAHKDYTESVSAIEKAVQVIKSQAYNRPQATALLSGLQNMNEVGTSGEEAVKKVAELLAHLSRGAEDPAVEPPEAHAYEFRSQGILDILAKLKDKFIDERSQLEKEEMSKQHAFDMIIQDLTSSIAAAKDSRSNKSQQRSKELQKSAAMKGDLQDTTTARQDDHKYLTDITATCAQKGKDFEERQKLRADEIVAVGKAIEILSSETVSGPAKLALLSGGKAGRRIATSLVQFGSVDKTPGRLAAAAYLHDQAERIHSEFLSTLAVRVRDDPFAKVKKMIQDLIVRLMEQGNEEASHKSWCDTELAYNEKVRTSRSTQVETLTSDIDQLKSSIANLGTEASELSKEVAEMESSLANQTKLRTEEKAKNEQTIKDAQEAQSAVQQALTILREFYARASEATAFVQGKHHQGQPEIFEGSYQGMGGESGGVIAMLEVVQADYARLESEVSAAEATAANDYDRLSTELSVSKAEKGKDIEHKSHQKVVQEQQLVDLNNDLLAAEKELDAAQKYFDKLKPSCLDAGMSYAERDQRRQEEIQSLQEALRILNGEDLAALQQKP